MSLAKLVNPLDANHKPINNFVLDPVNGTPGTLVAGKMWYDTATGLVSYRDGVASANINLRNFATTSGTRDHNAISDFDTQVRTSRLDQMAAPTSALNLNSQNIASLLDPTTAQQAATKNYVDVQIASALAGITYKKPARAATTANITTLAGGAPNTVDGVTLAANDRVLVKSQTTNTQNGLYTVTTLGTGANGTWTRATDADSAAELEGGIVVPVDEGTANGNTMWILNADVVTLGTDVVTFVQFGAGGTTYTASLGVQLSGTDIRANLGASGGLTLSGNGIVIDTAIVARIARGNVPSGAADAVITHNMGNKDVSVTIIENTTDTVVLAGVFCGTTTQVTVSFDTAPTAGQYRYFIVG
jgi:hypothetical protein